ncbi:MAG: hypothetical protein H6563_13985 [Lewinellaceae bacterium]|nr:hypothetical protein [Lewinellaceae bacterium]
MYTPLLGLGLAGIALLFRHARAWFWSILVFTALRLYFVSWYTSSFGSRAVVQSYAVQALPLGLILKQGVEKSPFFRVPLLLFAFACVALNQFQDRQYRHRPSRPETSSRCIFETQGRIRSTTVA